MCKNKAVVRQFDKPRPPENFGTYLRGLREASGLSLRDVEQAARVSNAYLSQVETGRVQRPSPHILFKLSDLYRVEHRVLMERAGHLSPAPTGKGGAVPTSALGRLTAEEEQALLEFLKLFRKQGRRREAGRQQP